MKRKIGPLALFTTLVLLVNSVFACGLNFKFYPTADSYVDKYKPSKNFGNKIVLYVGRESGTKRSYLKFDISSLDCDEITNARLNVYRNSSSGSNDYIGAYIVSENWEESEITWENAPTDFSFLDSIFVDTNGWDTWNITQAVTDAFNGNKIVSIALKFENERGSSSTQTFFSKEKTCKRYDPYLEIFCVKYECKSDEDCEPNYCSETYQDYCDGRLLVDYNSNKILDNITVENYCNNICQENHTCTNCEPDCSPPEPSSYCVFGICGAECDEQNKCQPKIENDTCYFNDECNLESCTCNYSQEQFCPEPGTVFNNTCYWGERSCSEEGCSLNKTFMESNNYCDPLEGPKDTEPPKPPILYASASGNSITLTWENASDNIAIDHFIIYRAFDSNFKDISGKLNPNQTSYIDSGLEYSKTYSYKIEVFDTSGNSANSSIVNATTGEKPETKPSVPSFGFSIVFCNEDWNCTEWSECLPEGIQKRVCMDLNKCGTDKNKPEETRACNYTPPIKVCEENWNCTEWSECINGTRTRICIDLNNCNTTFSKPAETEKCEEITEEAPSEITGMFALFSSSGFSFFLGLTIIAIILIVVTYRLEKNKYI